MHGRAGWAGHEQLAKHKGSQAAKILPPRWPQKGRRAKAGCALSEVSVQAAGCRGGLLVIQCKY